MELVTFCLHRKGPGSEEELSSGIWNSVQWVGGEGPSVSSQQPGVRLWKHIRTGLQNWNPEGLQDILWGKIEAAKKKLHKASLMDLWSFLDLGGSGTFCLCGFDGITKVLTWILWFSGFSEIVGPQWIFRPVFRRPYSSHQGLLCFTPQTGRGSRHPHKVPG